MIDFWCGGVLLQKVEDLIDDVLFWMKNAINFCEMALEEVRYFLDEA